MYDLPKGNTMHLSQDIKPISYLKAKTAEAVSTVIDTRRTMIITQNGEAKVVVQDIKSYENLQNSLALLKMLLHSEQQVRKGKTIDQSTVFEQMENKYFS